MQISRREEVELMDRVGAPQEVLVKQCVLETNTKPIASSPNSLTTCGNRAEGSPSQGGHQHDTTVGCNATLEELDDDREQVSQDVQDHAP